MSKNRRRNRTQDPSPAILPDDAVIQVAPAHNNGDAETVQAAVAVPANDVNMTGSDSLTLRSLVNALTLEVFVYGVIVIIAFLLRVVNLDTRPLAPDEAQTALAAWNFLSGKTAEPFASPLLFTLDWISFFLFGASDLTARFIPAALSTLLVLMPPLTRNALGKTGALVAALLIAFSPTLVFFARNLSAVDLAVGAALATLLFYWRFRYSDKPRSLYLAAFFAAVALTADSPAYPILITGALFFLITALLEKRGAPEQTENRAPASTNVLTHPYLRAAVVFGATYLVLATTFLLNRDGLGVAFNLFGAWLNEFAAFGNFTTPLTWMLLYEPLTLVFGLAGLVLALTLSSSEGALVSLMRMLALVALVTFLVYTLAGDKTPSIVIAVALPMMLLAGWFIGNLLERGVHDIRATGGWRSMRAGEILVFVMLMVLSALVYLQIVTFIQQTHFSPALDAVMQLFSRDAASASIVFAALTLGVIVFFLLGVFVGLSVMLVGVARTTTLMAFFILVLLALGTLRGVWQLNFSNVEPLREVLAGAQTPLQMRDLVRDLEWNSQWQNGDEHVIRIAADSSLDAAARWALRTFPNIQWTNQIDRVTDAQAVITSAGSPPPGNWRGQKYHIGVEWEPVAFSGLDLWKWYIYREGGGEAWETTTLWLPTSE